MQNNIFNTTRFADYLTKHLVENKRQLLTNLSLIFMLPLVVVILYSFISGAYKSPYHIPDQDIMWTKEITIFNIIFIVWAAVFGSKLFGMMSTKGNRISVLTNPASSLEKFTVFFLIYVVGFYVSYICATFFADFIRTSVMRVNAAEGVFVGTIPFEAVVTLGNSLEKFPSGTPEEYMNMLATRRLFEPLAMINSVLVIEAFFALGGILWQKNAAVKTASCGLAIIFICTMLWTWGYKVFLSGHKCIEPRFDPDWELTTFAWIAEIITLAITAFTYTLAYRRFKEAEIIHRW